MRNKKVFVSYKDDNDDAVNGYFELIEETKEYIKIKSENNIITLPYLRIKKIIYTLHKKSNLLLFLSKIL